MSLVNSQHWPVDKLQERFVLQDDLVGRNNNIELVSLVGWMYPLVVSNLQQKYAFEFTINMFLVNPYK